MNCLSISTEPIKGNVTPASHAHYLHICIRCAVSTHMPGLLRLAIEDGGLPIGLWLLKALAQVLPAVVACSRVTSDTYVHLATTLYTPRRRQDGQLLHLLG